MQKNKIERPKTNVVVLKDKMNLPIVPLRNLVIAPYMIAPIELERLVSLEAIRAAEKNDDLVFIVCQKDFEVEEPKFDDLFGVGCVCRIMHSLGSDDDSIKMLVEGIGRYKLVSATHDGELMMGKIEKIEFNQFESGTHFQAYQNYVVEQFEKYCKLKPNLTTEICSLMKIINDPNRLIMMIVGQLLIKPNKKIELLEYTDIKSLYEKVNETMKYEIDVGKIEMQIHNKVRKQIDEQQKNYFLNEQLKVIEKELGKDEDDFSEAYEARIASAEMPKKVEEIALKELHKLERMNSFSPEGAVVRNYLDWLCDLPWNITTKDNLELDNVQDKLDETHFGLIETKKRIVEFMAVRYLREMNISENRANLQSKEQSSVLCLVGPPGVGKTSVASSVAKAIGRKFVRISLGGVRDEAEIRGHRRTYVGAMPGRIVQALKKAGTKNPVILLDEIDKVASDQRGDPSSALLEVLDPEQNKSFNDLFLEVDLDLSNVMFICTANVAGSIHPTLIDRMEMIQLTSYTDTEKVKIAQQYLINKQSRISGITRKVKISEKCLRSIIRNYTSEAGVRQLDRSLAKIMRKIAVKIVSKKIKHSRLSVPEKMLKEYLGTPRNVPDEVLKENKIGEVIGLAWTEVGGEILKIEVATFPGKGELIRTGKLGDVMQESAQAALSYVRTNQAKFSIAPDFFEKHNIHIHVPEGAIPKDGPSAGITMASALCSAITGARVKSKLAMTGEITLNGNVLAVGGLKEKILAAHRYGINQVIVPKNSAAEMDEVPSEALEKMKIHYVDTMDEVIQIAFAN